MTLTEALNEQMKDESFKKEYDALGPEYEIISSRIDARKACNVTQNQTFTQKKSMYGIWKNESFYMPPDFDEPLEDFAEYM